MKQLCLLFLVFACISPVLSQTLNDHLAKMSRVGKPAIEEDYRIGPGDLLEIIVFGEDGLSPTVRVAASGAVTLPFLGSIQVAGMRAVEIEQMLTDLLSEDILRDPQVSVFVKEFRSKSVFVLGAVQRPGEYQIARPLRLVDAIAMAGGLDLETAGEQAVVQRSDAEDRPDKPDVVRVNLKQLLDGGDTSLNVALGSGDIVQVSEKNVELFYVVGEVNRPGAFQLPVGQTLLLTQAVAWAGGAMKTAKSEKGILVRYAEGGRREEIPVNFDDIIKGRKADFAIQSNDVLFIPGSKFKTLGYGLLGVIPRAAGDAAVYGPLR